MKRLFPYFIILILAVISNLIDQFIFTNENVNLAALPLMAAGLALGGAKSLFGMGKGIVQGIQAGKIDTTRPKYDIPKEIGKNVAQYQNLSNTSRMPGQGLMEQQLKNQAGESVAQMNRMGGSSQNRLAAIAGLNRNMQASMTNIGLQGAMAQRQSMDQLAQQRDTMAKYKDQAWNYNVNEPYMMRVAEKRALKEASSHNISTGLQSASDLAIGASGVEGIDGMFKKKPIRTAEGIIDPVNISSAASNITNTGVAKNTAYLPNVVSNHGLGKLNPFKKH